MDNPKKSFLTLSSLIILFFVIVSSISMINTNFGTIDVKIVSIPENDYFLSGLVYRPHSATSDNPKPAVLVTHGISNSKEVVSGIALELARRDFVVIALDEVGHGNSGGFRDQSEQGDNTLGVLSGIHWLESQFFVDSSNIGAVGHSMGAGAVNIASTSYTNIKSAVFLGGGVFQSSPTEIDRLNATIPKNLLVIIGKHDVLFDLDAIQNEILPPIFNTTNKVESGVQYGSFSENTARKLIVPETSHLLEPIDPQVTSDIVEWMVDSLTTKNSGEITPSIGDIIYSYRDFLNLIALAVLIITIYPLLEILKKYLQKENLENSLLKSLDGYVSLKYSGLIWGILGLILFLPMLILSNIIPIPPLTFGGGLAWWTLVIGLIGMFILILISKKQTLSFDFKILLKDAFTKQVVLIGIFAILVLYFMAFLMENIFIVNLRVIVPFINDIGVINRFLIFFTFIPFVFVYFLVENFYFTYYNSDFYLLKEKSLNKKLGSIIKVILYKILPFLIILVLLYFPMYLFNFRLFPGFSGFFIEFLVPILAIYSITSFINWIGYYVIGRIGTGIVINSLLVSWLASALFPLIRLI